MYYVYLIQSIPSPKQYYVGFSENLKGRLRAHNEGGSPHTAKYKPWKMVFYCAFPDKDKALAFEKYLKSHSGKAFTSKRLL